MLRGRKAAIDCRVLAAVCGDEDPRGGRVTSGADGGAGERPGRSGRGGARGRDRPGTEALPDTVLQSSAAGSVCRQGGRAVRGGGRRVVRGGGGRRVARPAPARRARPVEADDVRRVVPGPRGGRRRGVQLRGRRRPGGGHRGRDGAAPRRGEEDGERAGRAADGWRSGESDGVDWEGET